MRTSAPTARRLFFSDETFTAEQLEELERAFFWNVIARNGTFKTTNHRRLGDLNRAVLEHLPSTRPLNIMDVAVSSGVSTGEWVHDLNAAGIVHRMTAGDLLVHAWLISIHAGLHVLVDRTGYPLQFEVNGRAIRTPLRRREWLRHAPAILLAKLVLSRAAPAMRSGTFQSLATSPFGGSGVRYRPLKLVSQSLREQTQIEVVEDDILHDQGYASAFHVLRAANILNRVYFNDATLTAMLRNLRSRLLPGGILVICRTLDEGAINNASMFRLSEDGRLAVAGRLNDGSEIEDLALGLEPTIRHDATIAPPERITRS